jgi:hypothetical protein
MDREAQQVAYKASYCSVEVNAIVRTDVLNIALKITYISI